MKGNCVSKAGEGGTEKLNRAGELLRHLLRRHRQPKLARRRIHPDGRAGLLGAGGAVNLLLEFSLLLIVIIADHALAVRQGDGQHSGDAAKTSSTKKRIMPYGHGLNLVFILVTRADEGGFPGFQCGALGIDADHQRRSAGFHHGRIPYVQHRVLGIFWAGTTIVPRP